MNVQAHDILTQNIARELSLPPGKVIRAIELLDAGNTIPFMARYRKEVTGGLDEVQLQAVADRVEYLRALNKRRDEVLRSIEEQGKLTPQLRDRLLTAGSMTEVEDLYLPFRPKRKTRASVAREKGLGGLAELIIEQQRGGVLDQLIQPFLDSEKGVATAADALAGAKDIVAEVVAENASVRAALRQIYFREGIVSGKVVDAAKDTGGKYTLYYEFSELVPKLQPHRTLAINRAEKEAVLRVSVDVAFERVQGDLGRFYTHRDGSVFAPHLDEALEDSYKRLLAPSLEREVRAELTKTAEAHAISIFATNVRHLLLQPPLRGKKALGIDPGFRTGCKIAVVDETGKYLQGETIYPHPPQQRWAEAKDKLQALITRHGIEIIAIGNGTASRETETLVAEVVAGAAAAGNTALAYAMVSEAGASVYSASEVARKEFPDLEASQRGNISIARRLQEPLAELVKIDPKSVGVGLYQHDVDQKELGRALDRVVESCVNFAGVEVNTASSSLLRYVAGISTRVAENIVGYRDAHGPFRKREQLKKVAGLGPATFVQAAGFLKIAGGENVLDNTFIHPESYPACERLLAELPPQTPGAHLPERVSRFRRSMLEGKGALDALAQRLEIGAPTLQDILDNLEKPGLDPRDKLPKPILRKDVLKMEDLQSGMVLQGTVRNVVDFGAFVDIGVKHDGLVHVSKLSNRFVRNPLEVVSVGDVVTVQVEQVDQARGRISLTMRLPS